VRIQPSEREPRAGNAEPRQLARREIDDVAKQIAGQQGGHRGQRHVHRCEHDPQRFRPEHHGGA